VLRECGSPGACLVSSPSVRATAAAAAARALLCLGRSYIVGPELLNAIEAYDRVQRRGLRATIGYFNALGESPTRIADLNLDVLAALGNERHDGYLSIKVPAMKFDTKLVERIALKARSVNVAIHFDSHAAHAADATFAALETALKHTADIGCTLPGRWTRSLEDAERAIEHALRIRVVKGQWADPAQPDADPSRGFQQVIARLAGRARVVAVATHDPVLARSSLLRLIKSGTPCELELLYGLPMRAAAVADELGVPVRVYLPFGAAYMPYALEHLRRNPRVAWWMIKDAMSVLVHHTTRSRHRAG
jgi:proline dehydrogenase